jgi:hypothetical protein
MTTLYTSYYIDPSPARQAELNTCLQKNILNQHINKIVLLIEYPIVNELINNEKIEVIYIKGRPEYNTFFEIINERTGPEDWNIIANSDIYFDDTIAHLNNYPGKCSICLTRWEVEKARITFLNRPDSQDSWCVKGKIERVDGAFHLGKCGCDNAIMDRFHRAGYRAINPSKTIKSYHLHLSGVRSYNVNDKVKPPYMVLHPTA